MGTTTLVTRRLWLAFAAGPIASAGSLGLNYFVAWATCGNTVTQAIAAAGVLLALGGVALAWRELNALPQDHGNPRFLATLAMLTNTLFAIQIVAFGVPPTLLHGCG